MKERGGVAGEELLVAAGAAEARAEVLGGVVGRKGAELEPMVKAREEGAVAAEGEAVAQLVATKIEGGEVKKTPTSTKSSGEVVDLLAALQRSVDAAKTARGESTADEKPAKKAAAKKTTTKKAAAKKTTTKKATAKKKAS